MSNLINYIKDKIYYILGITVLIIIILVVISACSNSSGGYSSYEAIENKMVEAAQKYYEKYENKLPKENLSSTKVTIGTLQDNELLKEIKDPKEGSNTCSGYVEVTKVDNEYSYTPFLTCKGNYEPKYLSDVIKNVKQDEYGNGVYNIDGEYIYRGGDVKNYVMFNGKLWRIVKTDKNGDIKIVLSEISYGDKYAFDDAYNSEVENSYGINTNYLRTSIRRTLNEYYKDNFDKESKSKIVSKNLCVGRVNLETKVSVNDECNTIKENEKIGLLNLTDYMRASLDENCIKGNSYECTNYNYLSNNQQIQTWLLASDIDSTYKAIYLSGSTNIYYCSNESTINPVVYLTSKVIVSEGKGTKEEPYKLK